jgi:hypothetical protein
MATTTTGAAGALSTGRDERHTPHRVGRGRRRAPCRPASSVATLASTCRPPTRSDSPGLHRADEVVPGGSATSRTRGRRRSGRPCVRGARGFTPAVGEPPSHATERARPVPSLRTEPEAASTSQGIARQERCSQTGRCAIQSSARQLRGRTRFTGCESRRRSHRVLSPAGRVEFRHGLRANVTGVVYGACIHCMPRRHRCSRRASRAGTDYVFRADVA